MKIEHKLDGTQIEYGYIWWQKKKENEKYKQVFPEGEFTMDLEGEKLSNKKVDWKRGEFRLAQKLCKNIFRRMTLFLFPNLLTVEL